ncbi:MULTISPECIES: hypothetical protein [unclassified Paenibacillus]|uniref:hypothetical protein n=1 Tax=unclassified Paenibacillus TaxID=185978 RepID=UPI001C0F98EA|nr:MULTISPECIES: hypothetical protein [unclassified Paenibacillus]MBU5444320.1 hypothetical protein [Paenibacillus sp. MSJ-34]CAH0121049.1 hypothetical protein PAE9249_03575 [Paenibacillus sp. CECT 9249]
MLYYYWSRKGIRPSEIHNMPAGERSLIRAFYELELEERERLARTGNVWATLPAL